MTDKEKTMLRYSTRGQLKVLYAVHPNPRREGREVAYVIMTGDQPAVKDNAKSKDGWRIMITPPSTTVTRKLLGLLSILTLALFLGGCPGSILYDMAHPNRPYDPRIDGPLYSIGNGVPPMPTRSPVLCYPSGSIVVCY